MHKGKIEEGTLVLTEMKVVFPELEPGPSKGKKALKLLDGAVSQHKLSELTKDFSSVEGRRGDEYVSLRRVHSDGKSRRYLMVLDVPLKQIFDRASGYEAVKTLRCGVPFDVLVDGDRAAMPGRIDQYTHDAITRAVQTGDRSEKGVIKVVAGGERDLVVDETDALVDPAAVERIEDRGAYREIFMKDDAGELFRLPLHTETAGAALEKQFKLTPAAP